MKYDADLRKSRNLCSIRSHKLRPRLIRRTWSLENKLNLKTPVSRRSIIIPFFWFGSRQIYIAIDYPSLSPLRQLLNLRI